MLGLKKLIFEDLRLLLAKYRLLGLPRKLIFQIYNLLTLLIISFKQLFVNFL